LRPEVYLSFVSQDVARERYEKRRLELDKLSYEKRRLELDKLNLGSNEGGTTGWILVWSLLVEPGNEERWEEEEEEEEEEGFHDHVNDCLSCEGRRMI
jgi:hypothetical protein